MSSNSRNLVFPAIAGVLLIVTGVVGVVTHGNEVVNLDAAKSRLTAVESKVDRAESEAASIRDRSNTDGDSTVQAQRVSHDTAVIKELASTSMDWKDNATYVEARAKTMRAYALTDTSPFMKTFLPPAPVNHDAKGNSYPYIDAAKLNSSAADTTVKLLSVDGLEYSYLALVDVQSSSSDDRGTAVNTATLFVTVGGDGGVTKLSGYASTSTPLSSE